MDNPVTPTLVAMDAIIADVEHALSVSDEQQPTDRSQPKSAPPPSTASGDHPTASTAAPATASSVAPAEALAKATAGSPAGASADEPAAAAPVKQKKKDKKEKKEKKPQPPAVPIEHTQFLQCDLRVGLVTSVGHHPEADGLFVLTVSYGPSAPSRTVCAGLRKFLSDQEIANRKVVTICNLKPRKLRGIDSEAMILAGSVKSADDSEKETVVPITPPSDAVEGDVVAVRGIDGERTVVEGKFVSGKVWDKVVLRLGVSGGSACYKESPLVVADSAVTCDLPDGAEIH